MTRSSAAEKRAYADVAIRADGVCEGCGRATAIQMHHRMFRSRRGSTTVANLLHVCLWCHLIAESPEGHEMGWSVHSWGNPKLIPVLYRGVLNWLTDDGRAVPLGTEHEW